MTGFNPRDLASRVAGLIHGQFKGDLVAAAHYLDADLDDLRDIAEGRSHSVNLDLLATIADRFGVDACWLITGEYDWASHARELENMNPDDAGSKGRVVRLIRGDHRAPTPPRGIRRTFG